MPNEIFSRKFSYEFNFFLMSNINWQSDFIMKIIYLYLEIYKKNKHLGPNHIMFIIGEYKLLFRI